MKILYIQNLLKYSIKKSLKRLQMGGGEHSTYHELKSSFTNLQQVA